jgi:XTP/dITP diphosphohydrolase
MSRQPTLLVATHNLGKLREFQQVLEPLGFVVQSKHDHANLPEPEEDGDTFEANALIKARAGYEHTGIPVLADDSGLVVPSLKGEPGLYSARYAGVEGPDRDLQNRRFLQKKLSSLSEEERVGYFHCSLVLYNGEEVQHFEGRCHGRLLLEEEERGEHGFGYDPMMFHEEQGKTMAELTPEVKNRVSHRAHALQLLLKWLQENPSFRASLLS